MMPCCSLGDSVRRFLRDYDSLQSLAVVLLYIQIGCALVGSLGAIYNGVLLINLAVALFALVAIESSSQKLGRTYTVLLFCAILLDISWFILFTYEIWNISSDDYGVFLIFSVKLALAMQIVGFSVRLSSPFLWIQIYRLGVSRHEVDSDLRSSFLSPVTPAAVRQGADPDEVSSDGPWINGRATTDVNEALPLNCSSSTSSCSVTSPPPPSTTTPSSVQASKNSVPLLASSPPLELRLQNQKPEIQRDSPKVSFGAPSEPLPILTESVTGGSAVKIEASVSSTPSELSSGPVSGVQGVSNQISSPQSTETPNAPPEQPSAGKFSFPTPVSTSLTNTFQKTESLDVPATQEDEMEEAAPETDEKPHLGLGSLNAFGLGLGVQGVSNQIISPQSTETSNAPPEPPSAGKFSFPTLLSTSLINTFQKTESLDVTATQEDEMQEVAPETNEKTDLGLGSLNAFGLGSTPNSTIPKGSPFGVSFGSAATTPTSSPFAKAAPSGELFRPASFTFQSPQSSQPPNASAFSGGFGTPTNAQVPTQSGFGQPSQIGPGQPALGSVLGTFGQSRQVGSGFGGAGFASSSSFGGGFGAASSTGGGFASFASSGGGFGNMASGGGGFAGAASAGGGGFGRFAAAASSGAGFAGAAPRVGSTGGGFAALASSGGGFGRMASGGGGFSGAASAGGELGGFAAAASSGTGFAGAVPGGGFSTGAGFGAFGSQPGGGGLFAFGGGGNTKPAGLFTQMRK